MDETTISASFPLDEDGFLRRACPTCEREFKWFNSEDESPSTNSFYCPYCGVSAASDQWFTHVQLEHIEATVTGELLGPAMNDLERSLDGIARASGGFISASMQRPERQLAAPVFEPNDLRRVTFDCHPSEPVKIDPAWVGPILCLICGTATEG